MARPGYSRPWLGLPPSVPTRLAQIALEQAVDVDVHGVRFVDAGRDLVGDERREQGKRARAIEPVRPRTGRLQLPLQPVQGRVLATIVGGRTIYRDDSFTAEAAAA